MIKWGQWGRNWEEASLHDKPQEREGEYEGWLTWLVCFTKLIPNPEYEQVRGNVWRNKEAEDKDGNEWKNVSGKMQTTEEGR